MPTFPQPVSGAVQFAKMTLDANCELEAKAIVDQPKPSNTELATAYDGVAAAYRNHADPDKLRKQLDLFTVAAEDAKVPEPFSIYGARLSRMEAYFEYVDAQYQQNPTQEFQDELQAARDAFNAAGKIPTSPPSDQSSVQLPGWMSPG